MLSPCLLVVGTDAELVSCLLTLYVWREGLDCSFTKLLQSSFATEPPEVVSLTLCRGRPFSWSITTIITGKVRSLVPFRGMYTGGSRLFVWRFTWWTHVGATGEGRCVR